MGSKLLFDYTAYHTIPWITDLFFFFYWLVLYTSGKRVDDMNSSPDFRLGPECPEPCGIEYLRTNLKRLIPLISIRHCAQSYWHLWTQMPSIQLRSLWPARVLASRLINVYFKSSTDPTKAEFYFSFSSRLSVTSPGTWLRREVCCLTKMSKLNAQDTMYSKYNRHFYKCFEFK